MEEETLEAPSLDALRGLHLPEPVSNAPQTTAWWVLFAVIAVLLVVLFVVAIEGVGGLAPQRAGCGAERDVGVGAAEAERADAGVQLAVASQVQFLFCPYPLFFRRSGPTIVS